MSSGMKAGWYRDQRGRGKWHWSEGQCCEMCGSKWLDVRAVEMN